MEARIARLESDVRALRERMDTRIDRLESKLDTMDAKFDGKLTWVISLQLAFAAGVLGAMARGFGWL